MSINLPASVPSSKIIDAQGNMTNDWTIFFDQLLSALQKSVSPQGLVAPSQPAPIIAQLVNLPNGGLLYDSSNHLLKTKINGTVVSVSTTP